MLKQDKQFDKKKVGLLIKRKRQELGMTQEELAIKMNRTRQDIYNKEKDGCTNIEIIEEFCEVFKCEVYDFFKDSYDVEGSAGEIGKEILYVLLSKGGYITVDELTKEYMYGMNTARVNKELQKLSSIGMCIREQFVDFYDINNDGVFITAKGVIALKNSFVDRGENEDIKLLLKNVQTYEMIIGDFDSYQSVINSRELEKIVRNIQYCGAYRIDYLQWLHKTFHKPYFGTEPELYPSASVLPSLPGENSYLDIIFRMATGLDNEKIRTLYREYFCNSIDEKEKLSEKKIKEDEKFLTDGLLGEYVDSLNPYNDISKLEESAVQWFLANSESLPNDDSSNNEYQNEYSHDYSKDSYWDSLLKEYNENACIYAMRSEELDKHKEFLSGNIEKMFVKEFHLSDYAVESLREWFTGSEIKDFIINNYRKGKTKKEITLDKELSELNKDFPETEEYYQFPWTWKCGAHFDGPDDVDLIDLYFEVSGIELNYYYPVG